MASVDSCEKYFAALADMNNLDKFNQLETVAGTVQEMISNGLNVDGDEAVQALCEHRQALHLLASSWTGPVMERVLASFKQALCDETMRCLADGMGKKPSPFLGLWDFATAAEASGFARLFSPCC